MNNSYIVIGIIAVVLVLALFQVFVKAQTVKNPTASQIINEKTCGSCCGGDCSSCCANGICSKSTKGTSSCGC